MNRVIAALWWVVLSIWLVCGIAPSIVAISAFTTLPSLGISVTNYESFLGESALANGRFAAGFITEPVFQASDIVQLALAVFAVMLFAVGGGRVYSCSRFTKIIVAVALAMAVLITGIIAIGVSPPMNRELTAYRAAALQGDAETAERHLDAFNELHPLAERVHAIRAASLLALIFFSGFASGGPPPSQEEQE